MDVIDRIPATRLDRSRQAAPQLLEVLRERIVALDLPPGTVLPRADLADRFGVSQTPVRDALLRLAEEGLVDIFPQNATVVSRIDIASALRAHFLRRSLELEIVHELCSKPETALRSVLDSMREHMARQARAHAALDHAAFMQHDQDFHRAMYAALGLEDLWQLMRQRSGHIDRLRRLHLPTRGKMVTVMRDHRAIVDAVQSRDASQAQEAVRAHLAGTLAFVDKVRLQHPQWVGA